MCCFERRKAACAWTTALLLFVDGFRENVKLLCIFDSAETLSLRIELDYSGQTIIIKPKYFGFW